MTLSTLIALFIFMPLLELAVLFKIYEHVGFMPTLGLVVFTGFLGAFLAKHEGLRALRNIQRELALGRLPGTALMDGVMILAAGILLVTPGMITDVVGFLLLAPAVRAVLRVWLRRKFEAKLTDGSIAATWEEDDRDSGGSDG